MKTVFFNSKRHALVLLFLLFVIAFNETGCYTLSVSTDMSPVTNESAPKRLNRMFWGLKSTKCNAANKVYPTAGIQRVNFRVTCPEVLVTALTLGIYYPINCTYFLANYPQQISTHQVLKSPDNPRRKVYDTTLTGCHQTLIYSTYFTHDTVKHQAVIIPRFAWGLANSSGTKYIVPGSTNMGGLESLDIHVKFWEALATCFTLGIYCPVTYTYTFAYTEDEH